MWAQRGTDEDMHGDLDTCQQKDIAMRSEHRRSSDFTLGGDRYRNVHGHQRDDAVKCTALGNANYACHQCTLPRLTIH
jgi:hypothetical protein